MSVRIFQSDDPNVISSRDLKNGQIAEIVGGGPNSGTIIQKVDKICFPIGELLCNRVWSEQDFSVRILPSGTLLEIDQ